MYQFEIPYNFDKELIEQLNMLQIDEQIHSIYLPPYKEDYITAKHYYTHLRGRHDVYNTLPGSREEYESHIKLINQLFPNRLMLLLQQNNTLIKKELLYYYFNLGFKKFCVGSYNQAKIIRDELKDTNIEIIGSITMKIMPQD